jgi:hypothetical protein
MCSLVLPNQARPMSGADVERRKHYAFDVTTTQLDLVWLSARAPTRSQRWKEPQVGVVSSQDDASALQIPQDLPFEVRIGTTGVSCSLPIVSHGAQFPPQRVFLAFSVVCVTDMVS